MGCSGGAWDLKSALPPLTHPFSLCSQWYVAYIKPGNSTLTKGPGPLDPR